MKPILGAIADDLTGGMEIAAMLVGKGARVAFVTDVSDLDAIGDVEAVVVARKIRTVEPDVAVAEAEAAAQAFLAMGVRQVFFKYCATFDSTDRGNIGPVADRLADMTGAESTLFCPSYPVVGRTVSRPPGGRTAAAGRAAPTLQLMAGNASDEKVIDGEHV